MTEADNRRQNLRRLDDILEALEQLNLAEKRDLPDLLAMRLVELGVDEPRKHSIAQLIERVWAVQQPFLITLLTDRRRRRAPQAGCRPHGLLPVLVDRNSRI